MLDNSQLKKILPHAYPFLLLDRVEQYCPGKSLVAIKNITANEWPFSQSTYKLEHYPETLLIEAAAQAALVLYRISKTHLDCKNSKFILGQIIADFKNSIVFGQELIIHTFASKMLDERGYMSMDLLSDSSLGIGKVQVFYSVLVKNEN